MEPTREKKESNREATLAALLVDILNSAEVRRIIAHTGSEWISDRSRNSRLKRGMARPATWAWSKIVSNGAGGDLTGIFETPEHLEVLSREMPAIAERLGDILHAMANAIAGFPADRKKAFFHHLLESRNSPAHPPLSAALTRIAEDLYKEDPHFFSNRLIPLLENGLTQTDFGELKQFAEMAKSDISAFLNQAVGLLFEYPAKLITLLSFIPAAAEPALKAIEALLEHVNALPPDILTDLLLSLFRETDATGIGKIINRLSEMIRQLHTGSTLIGEMDAPRFTSDLRGKIEAVMAEIDPDLAVKARSALIDGRETLLGELIDAAGEHPEILKLQLRRLTVKRNAEIRLLKRKMDVFENLPEEEAVEALAAGLSSWNAYDMAETVNALSRTINRIGRINPTLLSDLVTEFVNALDLYELEENLEQLGRDLAGAVRPVFRMAAPVIINQLCDFFEPGETDDGYDEAMDQARRRLQRLILGKETL